MQARHIIIPIRASVKRNFPRMKSLGAIRDLLSFGLLRDNSSPVYVCHLFVLPDGFRGSHLVFSVVPIVSIVLLNGGIRAKINHPLLFGVFVLPFTVHKMTFLQCEGCRRQRKK